MSRTTCDFFHLAEGEEKEEEEEGGGEWTATGAFLSFLEGYRDLEEDQNKVCPIGRRTEQNTTEQNRSGVCVCACGCTVGSDGTGWCERMVHWEKRC